MITLRLRAVAAAHLLIYYFGKRCDIVIDKDVTIAFAWHENALGRQFE